MSDVSRLFLPLINTGLLLLVQSNDYRLVKSFIGLFRLKLSQRIGNHCRCEVTCYIERLSLVDQRTFGRKSFYHDSTWVNEQILNGTSARLYSAIHVGSRWKMQDRRWKNRHTTKTKHKLHNPEKANNAKHSVTEQNWPWFSRLIRHFARKRGRLILQSSQAHTGPMVLHICIGLNSGLKW